MIEISHNPYLCFAEECHEPVRLLLQRIFAGCAIRGSQFGFEVPVQVFVGIDLRRVRREIENLNLIFALSQPGRYKLRVMHFQVIEDQEDFLAAVGEGGRCPDVFIHRQTHKPAVPQVVLNMLYQLPLRADGEQ